MMTAGTRLGAYEIEAVLGAGGMGEVYRARDVKLGRAVAIKVVLDVFASDQERIARFEREAKVLASLNHPHIAALYGMDEADGRHFLVMELVEGETLADRLQRGPLAIEASVAIALQIAEALEAAHERGIVHRDLKPANVKLTADGRVKVLDFGLAKAVQPNPSGPDVANSPTFSVMASQVGVILGTAAYMSPEQAKGSPADHRSDVFSFGTVVYEMLAGRRPFQGDTATELLASVLVREADLGKLPPDLHPRFTDLLRRCLEKDPRRRWQAIGDVRAELETIAAAPKGGPVPLPSAAPPPPWRRALPLVVSAVVFAALGAAAAWYLKPMPAPAVVRFSIPIPAEQRFTSPGRNIMALAPDGSKLAYVADLRLYLRRLSESEAKAVPGTESPRGLTSPVFSPDGQWVAFYSVDDQTIKRVAITGGSPVTICPASNPFGISWSSDGILVAQNDPQLRGVFMVSSNGGQPRQIVVGRAGEEVADPQELPGNRTVLYAVATGAALDRWDKAKIVAQPMAGGSTKTILEGGSDARYLSTGHLVYALGGVLFAVPFDATRLETSGGPVAVIEGVRRASGGISGAANYVVSATGTLVYLPGPVAATSSTASLVISDREGKVTPLKVPPGPYQFPRASPDGTRIAFGSDNASDAFIAISDLSGARAMQRLTFVGHNRFPVWSGDSKRIAYQSDREGDLAIFSQSAEPGASAERLTRPGPGEAHVPSSWSPDGQTLLFDSVKSSVTTLSAVSLRTRQATSFGGVQSGAPTGAVFSPDGRWVAYTTVERRETDLYVQPFPATGAKYQLLKEPRDGPHHPIWSPDGRAIMFVPRPGGFASTSVTTQGGFAFTDTKALQRPFQASGPVGQRIYDAMSDGRILGFMTPGDAGTGARGGNPSIEVVLNWFEDLKARVPR